MFDFSSKTYVNKEYKVSDFLRQINASKEIRRDAKVIQKIFFQNVINSETLNVDANSKYKDIYIIKIILSEEYIPVLFVKGIDKEIHFHTYFMFEYDEKIATCIAYKEIGKQVKVDKYYSHGFNKDKELKLENVNSVGDVYKNLLSYEIGIKFRKDEDPSDYITRVKAINKLEFQISKTEKAIQFETQPKKKFEYNERLRKYKADYNDLIKVED